MTVRSVRSRVLAGPGTRLVPVGASLGSSSPALERREDITEQRPDEGQVGDEDSDGSLAEVPIHIDIGNKGGNKTVDLVEDGGHDDENTHAEQQQQNQLLLCGNADLHKHRNGDEQH